MCVNARDIKWKVLTFAPVRSRCKLHHRVKRAFYIGKVLCRRESDWSSDDDDDDEDDDCNEQLSI